MAPNHPRVRLALACLLLALSAGCATVETQPAPTQAAPATNTQFMQAQALAAGHAALSGQARRDNAARIDALLAQLDDDALAREAARLPAGDPLYNFAGRVLMNRGLPLPRPFDRGDASFGAADRPAADRDGYRPPLKVGLLLPLSGSQAAAASALRDGYLAGYYGEARRRPEIRFYDSAAGARPAYGRAVAEGNDLVVGPLGRDEVDALFTDDALAVPVLALNRGNRAPPDGHAGFSLSPEDEGISLAQYLIQRGARSVLVVAGSDDSQRRTAGAARAQLERRGVRIAASLDYRDDLAEALRQANADGAVDAVLLSLRGNQARTLVPQLAAAGLSATTKVAGSQITSGTGKASEDAVLDGIVHPIETWSVRNVPGLPSQASASARVATARGPAARLFAFGYDAWLLTAYLDKLATSANADVAGATGRLSLDGFGNVLRQPSWSRFSGGVPVPLADGAR
ncbi:hypothetical protein MASR1M8_24210 [Thermomonas brevis]